MHSKVLKDLDFERVFETLSKFLQTEAGKEYVKSLKPLSERERETQKKAVLDLEKLIENGVYIPLYDLKNGRGLLEKIRIGSRLTPSELRNALEFLQTYVKLYEVVYNTSLKPHLFSPELIRHVIRALSRNINESGEIREDATLELARLTEKKKKVEERLKNILSNLLEDYYKKGYLREKFYTIKNRRYVFPFKAEIHPQGVVQGYSNTDRTIYIEPYEIVDIENELIKVEDERKEEIERIIKRLVDALSESYAFIEEAYNKMAWIDFLQALARFKSTNKAVFVEKSDGLYIKNFRHPVLVEIKGYENVVPLTIEMFKKQGLFISGPNAGGKTVVLKSIGTIALSYLYGIPVIAEKAEIFPVKSVFTLGFTNEQDIIEGRSTFSGLIEEIKEIVENAGKDSMVLFDEPFSLTDPEEGQALAEAVITYLLEKGVRVFLTTHLWGLKFFAEEHPLLENATMLFDAATGKPLYKFRLGRMGKSHAIQIAQSIGLPQSIIERAKDRMTSGKGRVLDLIARLEEEEAALLKKLDEVERIKKELEEKELRLKKHGKKLVMMEYERVRKELKDMLRELYREQKNDKKIRLAQKARKYISEKLEEIDNFERPAENLQIGKTYKIKPTGTVAVLLEVNKKKAIVQVGKVKMEVPLESLYEV